MIGTGLGKTCARCGQAMVERPRIRVLMAAVTFIAAGLGLGFLALIWANWLAFAGLALGAIGAYLMLWATVGQSLWCENCRSCRISA